MHLYMCVRVHVPYAHVCVCVCVRARAWLERLCLEEDEIELHAPETGRTGSNASVSAQARAEQSNWT